MKIGIIVAMDKELSLLLPLMADVSEITMNGFTFHTGALAGHDIVACKCGIGKVNAAVGALTLIENFHPMMIVNTGVAGGTGATADPARVLDVVLASEIAYHDVWCGPGTVPGEAAGCPARFVCPLPAEIRSQLNVKEGLLASGDIFGGNAAAYESFWTAAPERTFDEVEKLLGLL